MAQRGGFGMAKVHGNLFAQLPHSFPQEIVEVLFSSSDVRLEKIVSTGQASPEGFWYDQSENEWVVVLQGAARMVLDDRRDPIAMGPGDYLYIPAHLKHRVEWTTPDEPTVWLAIFWKV